MLNIVLLCRIQISYTAPWRHRITKKSNSPLKLSEAPIVFTLELHTPLFSNHICQACYFLYSWQKQFQEMQYAHCVCYTELGS